MKSNYTNEQIERVISLVDEGLSITKASTMMCNEYSLSYNDSVRRYFCTEEGRVYHEYRGVLLRVWYTT